MNKRDFLKLFGAGLASIPFAGKMFKESAPEIKAVAKSAVRTLPKVKGLPEWFSPLVNKIMKEGVDISPKTSRLEDAEIIKKLEIPSKTGQPEIFTLSENRVTGTITIESKTGGVGDSPFEIIYSPPKKDINVETGKPVNYPGDFYVVENRPKPASDNPGKVDYDYDTFHIDHAHSDVEKLEKLATGKIKDVEKAEQRLKNKKRTEEYPYEDIMDRYPDPDYADGGIASFQYGGGSIGYANGGRIGLDSGGVGLPPEDPSIEYGQDIKTVPTGFNFAINRPMPVYQEGQPEISGNFRDLRNYINSSMGNINPQLSYTGDNFGGNVSAMMNPSINSPISYSADAYYGPEQGRFNLGFTTVPTADARQLRAGYEGPYGNISFGASRDPMGNNYMLNYSNRFADGGRVKTHLTRTIPPVRGPNPQGVETLFKRRYS